MLLFVDILNTRIVNILYKSTQGYTFEQIHNIIC